MDDIPEHPYLKQLEEVASFCETLTSETERGCALTSCGHLDAKLEELLRLYFIHVGKVAKDLLGQSRPLGSFAARIDLAYALGVIGSRARRELHFIREIRNDLAHDPNAKDFGHPVIASRFREFYQDPSDTPSPPRERYMSTVVSALAIAHLRCHAVARQDAVSDDEVRRLFVAAAAAICRA